MSQIYALIIVSFVNLDATGQYQAPFHKVISTYSTYSYCDKELIKTHDYYLAKDIRRKKPKQRSPKFIYDNEKNKSLAYKDKGILYFASCKLIEFPKKF